MFEGQVWTIFIKTSAVVVVVSFWYFWSSVGNARAWVDCEEGVAKFQRPKYAGLREVTRHDVQGEALPV